MALNDVVIDMDNVLADFEGYFSERFGCEDRRHIVKLEERCPEHAQEIRDFVYDPNTYHYLDVLPLGKQIVKYLSSKGFKIRIVSSRPPESYKFTKEWIERLAIQYDSLYVDNTTDKVNEIRRINPLFAIDDIGAVAEKLAKYQIPCILYSWEYNQGYGKKFPRIKNFPGFLYRFEQISKNGAMTNGTSVQPQISVRP